MTWELRYRACHVIIYISDPDFLSHMASYDVASTVHQSLRRGPQGGGAVLGHVLLHPGGRDLHSSSSRLTPEHFWWDTLVGFSTHKNWSD